MLYGMYIYLMIGLCASLFIQYRYNELLKDSVGVHAIEMLAKELNTSIEEMTRLMNSFNMLIVVTFLYPVILFKIAMK